MAHLNTHIESHIETDRHMTHVSTRMQQASGVWEKALNLAKTQDLVCIHHNTFLQNLIQFRRTYSQASGVWEKALNLAKTQDRLTHHSHTTLKTPHQKNLITPHTFYICTITGLRCVGEGPESCQDPGSRAHGYDALQVRALPGGDGREQPRDRTLRGGA